MKVILFMLIGALAAYFSNQKYAVSSDALRPAFYLYKKKKMTRKELILLSFAICLGSITGTAVSSTVKYHILLIAGILLSSDIIGSLFPEDKNGGFLSLLCGAGIGMIAAVWIENVASAFDLLPFNFFNELDELSEFVIAAFACFPAVAVGFQSGIKHAVITGIISFITYFVTERFGVFHLESETFALNGFGIALLAGILCMFWFGRYSSRKQKNEEYTAVAFHENAQSMRSHLLLFMLMGALLSLTAALGLEGIDQDSLAFLSTGFFNGAAMEALVYAISFAPMVFITSAIAGTWSTNGSGFVYAVGFILHKTPVLAFFAGAACMALEVLLTCFLTEKLDGLNKTASMDTSIFTAIAGVLEIAMLDGGIVTSEKLNPAFVMNGSLSPITGSGALFVILCVLLNRQLKKPLSELVVGPIACIVYCCILNILLLTGVLIYA